jgi:uncharacterized membrane protein YozB (DUF420 family)
MLRRFAINNKCLVSIILFLLCFIVIYIVHPSFLFNKDGSIRDFGVGYKNKTILPLWLFSIILGVLIYLFVLYYIVYPKIKM